MTTKRYFVYVFMILALMIGAVVVPVTPVSASPDIIYVEADATDGNNITSYSESALSAMDPRYVIVTTSAIEAASVNLADFVASKEARGFTVQVVTEETWGGSTGDIAAENIRSWLQDNYASLNITYVLLIGNPDPANGDVPMKWCYPEAPEPSVPGHVLGCATDFYYAELTSDWDADGDGKYAEFDDDFLGNPPVAAEVAVGRIPFYGNIGDLDHILAKTIAYETAPVSTISWRKNALLADNFVSNSGQWGEQIKDEVLIPNGWMYHRVYEEDFDLIPPPETTPCTVDTVTNAWKASDFGVILWGSHGSSQSAVDVMDLSHAATLDDEHPGFTFQGSCNNGWPEDSNNLGYSLLKNGCIVTVSASRPVGGFYDMALEYTRRLIGEEMYAGDAMNTLRLEVPFYSGENWIGWYNYLAFNIYGCPALGLFTSMSDVPETATIDFAPDTLNLRSRGSSVTVYVELAAGYDVNQVDISSIRLNGIVPPLTRPMAIGDYDMDGISDLMIKFNRAAVQQILSAADQVEIAISGKVADIDFEGTDSIRVIG